VRERTPAAQLAAVGGNGDRVVIEMKVPDRAVKYILFQRTSYLRFPNTLVYRVWKWFFPFSIYNQLVAIEARIDTVRIKTLYEDEMRNEYLSITNFLPKTCCSILDIGCGVAGD